MLVKSYRIVAFISFILNFFAVPSGAYTLIPEVGQFEGHHYVGRIVETIYERSRLEQCYGPYVSCDNPKVIKTFVNCEAEILEANWGEAYSGKIPKTGVGQIIVSRLIGNAADETLIDFKFVYTTQNVLSAGYISPSYNSDNVLEPLVDGANAVIRGNRSAQKIIKDGCYASSCPVLFRTKTALNFMVWNEQKAGVYNPSSRAYTNYFGHWGMKFDNKTRIFEVFSYSNSSFHVFPKTALKAQCK